MDDLKKRLIIERNELLERQDLLETFLKTDKFKLLDLEMQDLLEIQNFTMVTYLRILNRRLAHIKLN